MSKVNALKIQRSLEGMETVSVPWIQTEYDLDYFSAKSFLEQLVSRGWIKSEPEGIFYSVISDNLKLREIAKNEVDTLFEEVTGDCISALNCVSRNGRAFFKQIEVAVRGEDDTKEAIATLLKNNLLYLCGNIYYCCVSEKTIKVLTEVVKGKRQLESSKGRKNEEDEIKKIKSLFDELFDE